MNTDLASLTTLTGEIAVTDVIEIADSFPFEWTSISHTNGCLFVLNSNVGR